MKITGFNELQKKLDKLAKNAKKLDGEHSVPVPELLTPSFVARHTRFKSADELFDSSGFKIEGPEDFKAIPDEKWDAYIRSVSNFDCWHTMLSEATGEWAKKRLGI